MGSRALERTAPQTRSNPLALLVALVITFGVTVYPQALAAADGSADHGAAMLMFWAMSAGYVSGVGYRPVYLPFRLLFSATACILAVALAVWRLGILQG